MAGQRTLQTGVDEAGRAFHRIELALSRLAPAPLPGQQQAVVVMELRVAGRQRQGLPECLLGFVQRPAQLRGDGEVVPVGGRRRVFPHQLAEAGGGLVVALARVQRQAEQQAYGFVRIIRRRQGPGQRDDRGHVALPVRGRDALQGLLASGKRSRRVIGHGGRMRWVVGHHAAKSGGTGPRFLRPPSMAVVLPAIAEAVRTSAWRVPSSSGRACRRWPCRRCSSCRSGRSAAAGGWSGCPRPRRTSCGWPAPCSPA